jgi:hypothetical protein
MNSHARKTEAELLFFLHVTTVVILVVLAFLAPLWTLILIVLCHRVMLYSFDGCIISKMERKVRKDPNYDFFTEVALRSSGKKINARGSERIDLILLVLVIAIALVVHFRRRKR